MPKRAIGLVLILSLASFSATAGQLLFSGATRWSNLFYTGIRAPGGEEIDLQLQYAQLFGTIVNDDDSFVYDFETDRLQRYAGVKPSKLLFGGLDYPAHRHDVSYYDPDTHLFYRLAPGADPGVLDRPGVVVYLSDDLYDVESSGGGGNPGDADKDGISDSVDNCPNTHNSNQDNFDNDSQGDACDPDDDNDGVDDGMDAFPYNIAEWVDTDGDGIGNNADPDDDNDRIFDSSDSYPLDATRSVKINNSDSWRRGLRKSR